MCSMTSQGSLLRVRFSASRLAVYDLSMTVRAGRPAAVDALQSASDALKDAYRGVRTKAGKGVEHAYDVASVLRAADCPEAVQVVGLLHDVVEDTPWTVDDVAARFGPDVAGLVGALTEDECIESYRRRKRALREQIAAAGPPATDVALADKIASRRYGLTSGRRLPKRKRAHYEATLAIAAATARPRLAGEVRELLVRFAEREDRQSSA
jgi:(p)ppGpp synthase/HD superfamily hydrolase